MVRSAAAFSVLGWCVLFLSYAGSEAFSMRGSKLIYNIPNSGWASPEWNWGSAQGTGHDCASICRNRYGTASSRQELVDHLLDGDLERPQNFEEVKLVLALAWQRGRWDGSDGGKGGYGQVLSYMAEADRYENGSEQECAMRLIHDMQERYNRLHPTTEQAEDMSNVLQEGDNDVLVARRRCSGLVLQAMGFVKNGC